MMSDLRPMKIQFQLIFLGPTNFVVSWTIFNFLLRLEAFLEIFRDYVNLVVLQYSPIVDRYCHGEEFKATTCKKFSRDLDTKVRSHIKYVQNAVSLILAAYGKTTVLSMNCSIQSDYWLISIVKVSMINLELIEIGNIEKIEKIWQYIRTDDL